MKKRFLKICFFLIISSCTFIYTIKYLDKVNIEVDKEIIDILLESSNSIDNKNRMVNKLVNTMLWYRGIFIILESFAIFILIIINKDKFTSEKINVISSLSFSVYLIHAIILFIIKDNINIINYPPIIGIPLISLIIYISSLLIAYIFKKISIVNKII